MEEKFYIGIDIGTESVGFSATDGQYNVLKVGGKPLMGVRLFDEAKTSQDRRVKRANKVRKNRQKQRLTLLQSLFYEEISKIDPLFFIRLSASSFWEDDKKQMNEKLDFNSIFADKDFNDSTYFKKFESIYHLRKELMDKSTWQNEEKPDLRLVYLACHHILKNRGHFLWNVDKIDFEAQGEGSIVTINKKLKNILNNVVEENRNIIDLQLSLPSSFDKVLTIFKNDTLGKKAKREQLTEVLFDDENIKKQYKKEYLAILKAIVGENFNLNDMFAFDKNIEIEKDDAIYSFDSVWEETATKIANVLDDDDKFALIESLKELYDFGELNTILKGEKSISVAMVKRFKDHKNDLGLLKKFVKDVFSKINGKSNEYYKIFRSDQYIKGKFPKPDIGNYANYIGSNLAKFKEELKNKKVEIHKGKTILKKVTKDGFYSFLLKEFADNGLIEKQGQNPYTVKDNSILTSEEKEILTTILNKIESGVFLPKLRTKDNGTIPFQIHKYELETILNNAKEVYNFLNEVDNDKNTSLVVGGKKLEKVTVKDKILSLISFRVPYYVGRLNTYKGENDKRPVWAVRKQNGVKITPWTIDNVIDYDKSAEKFIDRMLSKCTYLINETVLPKNSLLYSNFMVLNELNNLKIRGEKISVSLKQDIYNELFKNCKNVTMNRLLNYLEKKGDVYNDLTSADISGFDKEGKGFNSSLSSFIATKGIMNELIETYKMTPSKAEEVIENVLLRQALHSDKDMVAKYIRNEYPEFDDIMVKNLKGLNYGGFGNLSKKFLTGLSAIDIETGELNKNSIIDLLWNTNENLQQIVANNVDKYGVRKWIEKENAIEPKDIKEEVFNSYGSPSVKRAVWESIKVINELISLNGNKIPDKIFVEVTRGKGKKNDRKDSRKVKLQNLYKDFNKKEIELANGIEERLLNTSEAKLRSEKLFLYFLQCGKCAYSKESIKFEDLFFDNKYDVDHIIPQALLKDDSLNNKVLVKKELNSKKDKNYPLNKTRDIYSKIKELEPMWLSWLKAGLMTKEKYERLTRKSELEERELEGFIARQLVFTGQSATLVSSLLKKRFANTGDKVPEIVYSKAENVSKFRQKFDIVKCRDVNDIHHSHDAYLNIVVGNVYNERFNHSRDCWKDNVDKYRQFNQNHMFEYEVGDVWKINLSNKPKKKDFYSVVDGKLTPTDEEKASFRKAINDWCSQGETIKRVKKVVEKSWYPVTKKVVENKGAFYDETLYGIEVKQKHAHKDENGKLILMDDKATAIPLKGSKNNPRNDYKKYGYFTSINPAYFMIVEYSIYKGSGKNKKEHRQRQFVGVPILYKKQIEKDIEQNGENAKFLTEECGFINPKIIIKKVYKYTLFELDGTPVRISGLVEWQNAVQWFADKDTSDYVKLILKCKELLKKKTLNEEEYKNRPQIVVADGFNKQIVTRELNVKLFDTIKSQLEKAIYKGNKALFEKLTEDNKLKFIDLNIIEQIDVLLELFKALSCGGGRGNIKKIGGIESFGRFVGSQKINTNLVLIEESVTGLKTKKTTIYPFSE